MRKSHKELLKDLLPPLFLRRMKGISHGWYGKYSSWSKALEKCSGYNSHSILEKVTASALKVKEGSSAYERDSMLFDKTEYSFALLAGLMWIAAGNCGRLNVLDFGGSLGSSYFQNKKFLDSLDEINWCIVEQPGFVKAGIKYFADNRLHFFHTIEECLDKFDIDVIVFSSVLQYMEEPFGLLEQVSNTGIPNMIIDRTPFVHGSDRITVQMVNPRIYRGSYPCWFFNEKNFLTRIEKGYDLIAEFDALDQANIRSKFKGFILRKKQV
jgi:putative methyltransferase (TIGR04325 family)